MRSQKRCAPQLTCSQYETPIQGLKRSSAWLKRSLLTIRRGRQFPKQIKSRTVEFGVAVVSQEQTTCVMTLTCRHCKKPGYKKKDCNDLMGKSDKSSNVENGTRKWCSYHHSNGHSNENCYQQQQSGEGWCTYHKSGTHSNDQCNITRNIMVAVTLPLAVKVQKR